MVTEFFNDIIFREEDIVKRGRFSPGYVELFEEVDEECEVFIVRVGENPAEKGE